MKELLTFNDVLISPNFSFVESRKDVDLSIKPPTLPYMAFPIISANMDSVTGSKMAKAMQMAGGQAVLHRFCSIENNVKTLSESKIGGTGGYGLPFVSLGLGAKELDRAVSLFESGAVVFVIDVAHGASMAVVKQARSLRQTLGSNVQIVIGNFATGDSVRDFLEYAGAGIVDAIKVGIGPGSACTTRVKTGVGYPQISAIIDIAQTLKRVGTTIIADGGMKTCGDVAKALGAGAHMVMLGGMLSGTDETPGDLVDSSGRKLEFLNDGTVQIDEWVTHASNVKVFKKYRGSASKESYKDQGKEAKHRTSEGESFLVPYKGPVSNVLQDIEGGLRSAFSYVGASDMSEFHAKVDFVRVSASGYVEGLPHGKK